MGKYGINREEFIEMLKNGETDFKDKLFDRGGDFDISALRVSGLFFARSDLTNLVSNGTL